LLWPAFRVPFFSGCAAFGLPLAPLTLLLPASPLAIYSLCPLHSGIRTGAGVIFFGLCHGVSPCRHGFRGRCFHMRPWAFGPPAIDCEPCHEVWPSGLSCSGSCRQLVDLNCPSARRGCPCGFRVSMLAMLSCILCPLHTGIRTGAGVIFFGFCHGVSLMAPAQVGVASICRLYRLRPNLALYCWLCRLCRDVWTRCGFYSAVAQWPWFLVPSAMRLVMACFQGAFF
jgi:hypothetical protein